MDQATFGLLFVLVLFKGIDSQRQPRCEQGSCYPATGDLLIGREQNLTSSSTCGLTTPERYCIVSHLEQDTKCFTCDSRAEWDPRNQNSHRVDNIVSSFRERKLRWWQAENGKQQAYIQLDLEAEFHFTHLIMTFKTFRPKALLIERSYDFGKTWKVYRYFAYDCAKSFPSVKVWPPSSLEDVICEDRYSDVAPSTEGEVIFRVLPPFIQIDDPYKESVQDLLKLTNLRVNFTELHTLGDTLLDSRPKIKEKYYYAMYDMTVRGSCSCYGHASRCEPLPGYTDSKDMVHGQCVCAHNTTGRNCEMCQDFYQDLPWRPARQNQPNECKKCNCNNHSTKCRFDAAVYESSGRISGGVCLDCLHNTMGKNCQQCKEFYYQDPNQDIRSFDICKACDCDPRGSLDNGQCDDHTDAAQGLVAGKCHCRTNVEGKRCDTCMDGFWNLHEDNPDGCEACRCNQLGTIDNAGCDKFDGRCLCKRYVTGQNCDQCYPGFWGLSADLTGCQPCDCDVGGAVSEECDLTDGRCTCKPNIIGRKCDQPRPEYYFAKLDYLLYEAEYAKGYGNIRPYIREPYNEGYQSWSGPGFMQIVEGDSLEFNVDNIEFPMSYDIVIRYDPRMPDDWEDIRVYVIRQNQPDKNGPCANHRPSDDEKDVARMSPGARYVIISPSACLEPGVNYTIRIDFQSYKSGIKTPEATTLIDSIILVPATNSIPIFQGIGYPEYMKNNFVRYRCRENQLSVFQQPLQDFCKMLTFSISSSMMHRALACDCDPTGSLSAECEQAGGQCRCKTNVVGRRCDRCAPGTYGLGPEGCKRCDCHSYGARDNLCDSKTGQCLCIQNVGERTCDTCVDGYWGFPQCRQCSCNGNADTCEDLTGNCIGCKNFTAGDHCENCIGGYYGDPRINVRIPCRECKCPGGPLSPVQHADSCYEDRRSQTVVCACKPGFQGPNCNTCQDNYFGTPSVVNGTCEPCICNNNIELNTDGNCDTTTGECLKCLYNSEGFNCEKCRPGYFGDAITQSCSECVCDPYGTNMSAMPCDRFSGQCPCLPNVIGQRCDQCDAGYWNITSGQGCSACGCDPDGSLGIECNQFDGQCQCVVGRGGQDCSQCEDFFWGDPTVQCQKCDCNNQGSAHMQCDRRTGQCACLPGISGYKCDKCDRGTTGELPNCKPCGECFDNWDRVVRDLRGQTEYLVNEALKIKSTGVEKAFEKEFQIMEENINEVKDIIRNANISSNDVREIEVMLQQVRDVLNASFVELDVTEKKLDARMDSIRQGNNRIAALKMNVEDLKIKADELRNNATDIQINDVEGAFNVTKEAEIRSRQAQQKVDATNDVVNQSQMIRQDVEDMLNRSTSYLDKSMHSNKKEISDLNGQVTALKSKMADLNEMVCDRRGDPCDDVCGGGGCGTCGSEPSCDQGAVRKAENALDLARKAEDILNVKEVDATALLNNLRTAQQGAEGAKNDAQLAYNEALKVKNQTENARTMLQDLLFKISGFLDLDSATPEEVTKIAEDTLAMRISLTQDQIHELAQEINATIRGLDNVDSIINATSADLDRAKKLKERAKQAEEDAKSILEKAEDVLSNLKGAKSAQDSAENAIGQADKDISDAESFLLQIESETAAAADKSNQSRVALEKLRDRLNKLQSLYIENQRKVTDAEEAANKADMLAKDADQKANELANNYANTADTLDNKYNMTTKAQTRAQKLKERADKLAGDTTVKLQRLEDMEKDFNSNEKRLLKLSNDIDELNRRMTEYLSAIQNQAKDYYNCKT